MAVLRWGIALVLVAGLAGLVSTDQQRTNQVFHLGDGLSDEERAYGGQLEVELTKATTALPAMSAPGRVDVVLRLRNHGMRTVTRWEGTLRVAGKEGDLIGEFGGLRLLGPVGGEETTGYAVLPSSGETLVGFPLATLAVSEDAVRVVEAVREKWPEASLQWETTLVRLGSGDDSGIGFPPTTAGMTTGGRKGKVGKFVGRLRAIVKK